MCLDWKFWFKFHDQYSQGGPVIAFQVENEYGSFGKHELSAEYMARLKKVRSQNYFKIISLVNTPPQYILTLSPQLVPATVGKV